jgi:hypothetical protein
MRASAQVTAPGATASIITAVSTRPNRQNRSTCSRMSVPLVQKQKLGVVMAATARTVPKTKCTPSWLRCHLFPSWQTKSLGRRGLPSFGEFGLRMHCCILNGSPRFVTRELGGEYNQSCQQYRSDNSISPKPATKRFLIFRIEPLILIDPLSAHRPLLPTSQAR